MPKAKLELTAQEAARVPAIHAIVGSTTADEFKTGKTYITEISARSSEQLVKFGRLLETVTEQDVADHLKRTSKKEGGAK